MYGEYFWVKDEKIFTPDLETGCLKGTTRSLIAENFPVKEMNAKLVEINNADDIFLTSSGLGILRVANFETVKLTKTSNICDEIKQFFNGHIKSLKNS